MGLRGIAVLVVVACLASLAGAAPRGVASDLRSSKPEERLAALDALLDTAPGELEELRRQVDRTLVKILDDDDDPEARARAARLLVRLGGKRAIGAIVDALTTELDPVATAGLVAAFTDATDPALRLPVAKIAYDPETPRAAALAAEALGSLPDRGGMDDLLGLLRSAPHWAVTAGACRGLANVRDPKVMPVLLARLRDPDPAVRAAARDALVELSGQDSGIDPRDWEHWWAEMEEVFKFTDAREDHAPKEGESGGAETSDEHEPGNRPTFARFFGIPITGRRVCFVIDYSQSMWGDRRARAEKELVAAVKGLPGGHSFSVICFNEKVWWFHAAPLPARPQYKLDLVSYLPEQETKSYTNIYDSLERALGMIGIGAQAQDPAPGLDEIVFLSDGEPNRGRIKDVDRILEAVELLNGGRVKIHTVGLGQDESQLLVDLADQNGGSHVHHSFPK